MELETENGKLEMIIVKWEIGNKYIWIVTLANGEWYIENHISGIKIIDYNLLVDQNQKLLIKKLKYLIKH